MRSFVIHLPEFDFSLQHAVKVNQSLVRCGFESELWCGINGDVARVLLQKQQRVPDPANLHRDHGTLSHQQLLTDFAGSAGCFYSHFSLWQVCAQLQQEILIFEDDVRFYHHIYQPVSHPGVVFLSVHEKMHEMLIHDNFTFTASGYRIDPDTAERLLGRYQTTYDLADWCLLDQAANAVMSSWPMGRKMTEQEGKPSLVMQYDWLKELQASRHTVYE